MHPSSGSFLPIVTELFTRHWLSVLFVLLTGCTLVAVLVLRWWIRRRWQRFVEEESGEEHQLDLLPPLSPQDQEALQVIKEFRRAVWEIPETELQLGVEVLTSRAMAVVRSIARVYYPQCAVPEYEATLQQSLHLVQRVSRKVSRLASIPPWNLLGNRKLSDYQRYYQLYLKINENPVLRLLKRHRHLYRIARLAMNLKNIGNPFYWAGKELSREGYFLTLRWFYQTFISQVGREAMKLYSGRHFQREEERDATLVCHKLFALSQQWEGPQSSEWATLVDVVTGHSYLESEVKLHILARWSHRRIPKHLERQPLQTGIARDWYREGLKKLLKSEPSPTPIKRHLIEQELAALARESQDHAKLNRPSEA
jgi:hypothetical protein